LERYDIKVSYDIELERSAGRHLLLREWLLPVCAPDFRLAMAAGETNAKPVLPVATDLATHRLLLNAPDAGDWRCWLAAHGCDRAQVKQLLGRAMALPTDMAAIEMAVGGYGIALANLHYVAGRLAEGFLVPAFDVPAFPLGGHFLGSDPRMARRATRRFIAWLDEEARASAAQISGWCGTIPG
jgi:DNA-binding transcriptional LysR family regulator